MRQKGLRDRETKIGRQLIKVGETILTLGNREVQTRFRPRLYGYHPGRTTGPYLEPTYVTTIVSGFYPGNARPSDRYLKLARGVRMFSVDFPLTKAIQTTPGQVVAIMPKLSMYDGKILTNTCR